MVEEKIKYFKLTDIIPLYGWVTGIARIREKHEKTSLEEISIKEIKRNSRI